MYDFLFFDSSSVVLAVLNCVAQCEAGRSRLSIALLADVGGGFLKDPLLTVSGQFF